MDGAAVRIENSSRGHAESLHLLLTDFETKVVENDGAWQVEVQLGELSALLLTLFDRIGAWLETEQVDSLFLHFDERQFTLLRPSGDRLKDSNAFLLERVSQLETALASRIAIEQAKGILARTLGVSTDEAFNVLRKAARDSGTKLRDIAASLTSSPADAEAILAGATRKTA